MSIRSVLGALICLLPGISIAAAPTLSIPDTPAGHSLTSWLATFNSGDSTRIKAFDDEHAPWLTLDRATSEREHSGGYELLDIGKNGKLWITFGAKEKASSTLIRGTLVVKPDNPSVISLLLLEQAGTQPAVATVNAAERDQVIEGAAKRIAEFYVSPELGQRVAATLRAQKKRGDYQDIVDSEVLASRLTDDLRAFSHDRHLSVRFSTHVVPPDPTVSPEMDPDTDTALKTRLKAGNCGFEKAEHLAPNIGYLKFNLFAEPKICAPTARAAMAFLADSDILVIDLRDNHGGSPRMAVLIASYLFPVPTLLDSGYDRQSKSTEQLWTYPYEPVQKFTGKPVFVLTSRKTFSAAELFSYDLKVLKRATLIGETTGGGAHATGPHRLGDHFFIEVPFGGYINPITKTDWEGTGVEPDVEIPAADALDEALKHARQQTTDGNALR